jgi:hypothetical protein
VRRDAAVIEAATRASENDKKPNRSAFKSQDDFDTALIDWSTRSAMRSAQAAAAKERLSAGERQRTESIARSFHQRTEKFVNEKADFREVVLNPHLPISEAMAAALVSEPNGPAVAYHLGKNPKEADRIARLLPVRQQVEIGKLAAKLSATPAATPKPRVTPKPTAPAPKSEPSMADYARLRVKPSSAAAACLGERADG